MKLISTRDFQLHMSKYLKNLPIVLTIRGEKVAIVNTFQESVNTNSQSVNTSSQPVNTPHERPTPQQLAQSIPGVKLGNELSASMESTDQSNKKVQEQWGSMNAYCRFCAERPAKMMPYSFTDGTGEGEAFFCQKCWNNYSNEKKPSTIHIESIPRQTKPFNPASWTPVPKPKKKEKKKGYR